MSVVIHEVSHGFVALYFGDQTAKYVGRLTLNPLKHLDLFGSVILPLLLYISAGFAFGWARPVPYNPDNLRNKKWGTFFVASAGVLANLLIAVIFGLIMRFSPAFSPPESFYFIVSTIVIINIALAVFNLVPIPPLDGSKILFTLLPASFNSFTAFLEQYSLILLIAFIFFFSGILFPVLSFLFSFITGFSL